MAIKKLEGTVVSNKMQKTVVVEVNRLLKHPHFKKYVRRKKKFYADHDLDKIEEGDKVLIEEAPPVSKLKRWRVIKVFKKQ